MNKLPAFCTATLALATLLAGHAFAAPSAQLLDAVKKPQAIDPEWRTRLCALLPQPCDPQELGLYRIRGASASDFAVLSAEPLAMARVRRDKDAKAWQLERLHDFSAYVASMK